jgi:Cu+-exporting ATPase
MATAKTHGSTDRGSNLAPPGHLDLAVEDITCGHCAARVADGLKAVDGVLGVSVDLDAKIVHVDYDPRKAVLDDLLQAIRESGYTPGHLTVRLSVEGMHCLSCVAHIEGALEDAPGVVSASVDLAEAAATIDYLPNSIVIGDLVRTVENLGYHVTATPGGDA